MQALLSCGQQDVDNPEQKSFFSSSSSSIHTSDAKCQKHFVLSLFSGYVSSPQPKISDWSWFVLVMIWACVLKHIVPGTRMWDMVNIRLELPSPRPHVHTPLHHFPPPLPPPSPPRGLFLQLLLKKLLHSFPSCKHLDL